MLWKQTKGIQQVVSELTINQSSASLGSSDLTHQCVSLDGTGGHYWYLVWMGDGVNLILLFIPITDDIKHNNNNNKRKTNHNQHLQS